MEENETTKAVNNANAAAIAKKALDTKKHWTQVAKTSIEPRITQQYGKRWRNCFSRDVQDDIVMSHVATVVLGWSASHMTGEDFQRNMQAMTMAFRLYFFPELPEDFE